MPPIDLERRRRRNRRLSILGLVVVLMVGGFTSAYMIRKNQAHAAAEQRAADSIVAYEQGEYERVVELLEDMDTPLRTIRVIQGDADAMWRYVQARREVPLNNAEHIARLFPALRQVVALNPGNREAGQFLLELLMAIDRNTEALDTADRLIQAHPDDIELLRIRYAVNMRLNNDEAALDDALAAAQLNPLDVRTQMDVATLMRELNSDPEDFHRRATALLEANPTDPRAEVILARAWLLVGDPLQARLLLESASDREPPDEDFVRILVDSLDGMYEYEDSYNYLAHAVEPGLDNSLQIELFLRDYERENDADVVARLATTDLTEAHPNQVALAALSYRRMGDTDGADAMLAELSSRIDDALAEHWVKVLSAWWHEPDNPGKMVEVCAAACDDNPLHPYLHYLLAESYRAIGEREAAAAALEVTHKWRPSWAHPYFTHAELLLELGRADEAEQAALAALRRRPVPAYGALYGVAQAKAANGNDRLAVDRALAFIDDKVQEQFPGEPRSYVAAIDLLARANRRDQAAGRIRTALEREPTLPQDALLQLADLSRNYKLGMENAIFARARAAYGVSPRVALAQALDTARQGSDAEALEILRNVMPDPAPLPWQVAEAQLMQHLGADGATAKWVQLADNHPNEQQVQRLALAAVGVQQDRAFADRAIQRLRELGGPDSVTWKVERARYLLGSDNPQAVARQAAELLEDVIAAAPNRVEPHRLLAQCHTLRGDLSAAARSIEQAANLSPDDMRIQFQLGQMLHNQQEYINARLPLLRVARNDLADPNLRLNALVLLSRAGEVDTLIPILEGLREQYSAPDQQEILLANLYIVTGRGDDADEVCELMLRNPTPGAIAYASDYYWRTGRLEEAKRVIELVNTVEMSDVIRHTILGQHAARLNEPELALNHYRAAARAEPDQAEAWTNLVVLALVFGRPAVAIDDAREAMTHLPDDPAMRTIVNNAGLLTRIAGDLRFRPLAATIAAMPEYRAVGLEALRLIVDASDTGRSTGAVARDLAALADDNPMYLPLQNLAAAMLSDVRQYEPASVIAARTMAVHPADGMSARLATVAYAETGQWRQAISASQHWARRSPSQRPLADVYLSAAQRNLGRVKDALQTLAPHLGAARANPEFYRALLAEYATALVQDGRFDDGWAVIQPNLTRNAAWRELAMDLAGATLPASRMVTQWLDTTDRAIPADSGTERILLAQASFQAGDRLRDTSLIDRARAMIDQATGQGQAPSGAWFLRGRIADRAGDLQAAEDSYREVLRQQPNSALAQNNLAMVLLARGRKLDEALDLARAAARAEPDDPNMKDTLAQVLSRQGEHEEALRVIEQVIQMDRQNLAWIRTKAQLLQAAGRADEAERLRQRYGLAP